MTTLSPERLAMLARNRAAALAGIHNRVTECLQYRADNYRLFMPEWPALWQTFAAEAAANRRAKRISPQPRKV